MVALTRLNGQSVAINPDLITWIEVTPDTTVSLISGDKILVRESLDTVIDKIVQFRRMTNGAHTSHAAISHAARSARPPHLRLSTVPPTGDK